MNIKPRWLICLVALGMVVESAVALSLDNVAVHGLTNGRAVLKINGKYVVLKTGESHQQYTLVGADDSAAKLRYKGKIYSLALKNTSLIKRKDNNFINNAHPNTAQQTAKNMANTHIISSRVTERETDSLTFEVQCFYNGQQGDHAQLRAYALNAGRETGFAAHTYTALSTGRNRVSIKLMMNAQAPTEFNSQQVRFEIIGSKLLNGSYVVAREDVPLNKTWSRPVLAPVQFQLGGDSVWRRTGSH